MRESDLTDLPRHSGTESGTGSWAGTRQIALVKWIGDNQTSFSVFLIVGAP